MVEQQNAYNSALLQALEQAVQDRERLAATLVEYNRESGRDLAQLADEVRRLRARLVHPEMGGSDGQQPGDDGES
jgi:hypothetical protein